MKCVCFSRQPELLDNHGIQMKKAGTQLMELNSFAGNRQYCATAIHVLMTSVHMRLATQQTFV